MEQAIKLELFQLFGGTFPGPLRGESTEVPMPCGEMQKKRPAGAYWGATLGEGAGPSSCEGPGVGSAGPGCAAPFPFEPAAGRELPRAGPSKLTDSTKSEMRGTISERTREPLNTP
jgi:hypothetical protein